MALRRYHNDLIPFPGPNRTNVFYPNVYGDYGTHPYRPYDRRTYGQRGRRVRDGREYRERRARDLLDRSIQDHGDLGWPLDYATAWCYKYLVGSQTQVADVIDKVRGLDDVEEKTPYMIFDLIDRAMFAGKLKGMVHLRWKPQASSACGRTSAPGVMNGIARICIDLNSVSFEEDDGDLDDLLDALIHQMIHAFFLVCCGAQPKGVKPDGRLTDGVHFGVILMTIRDISRQCQDGPVPFIFYAHTRRKLQEPQSTSASRRRKKRSWIAVDPQGSAITAPPADGQSHCSHDNRRIHLSDLKNWQVEKCSLALELNSDERGDVIYNLGGDGQLIATDRLKGPPSASYVELIWDDKRIMIPREKSLKFPSMRRPIERQGKMELKLPDCSMSVLRFVYDFLQHGLYWEDPRETLVKHASRQPKGPPVLVPRGAIYTDAGCGMLDHIRVFKIAESMKFEELQLYALQRLYDMPTASDDPIETLKELYNEGRDRGNPIHAELHKWARKFLAKSDATIPSYEYFHQGLGNLFSGTSNYAKIYERYEDRFKDLYHRNAALKDDCKLVYAELAIPRLSDHEFPSSWDEYSRCIAPLMPSQARLASPRPRSWSNLNLTALDWPRISPIASTAPSVSGESVDDIVLGRTSSQPNLLDWAAPRGYAPPVSFEYYGRDEAPKQGDILIEERITPQCS